MHGIRSLIVTMAALLYSSAAMAQLPVEVFGGHKKATADIMFFRYVKNKEGKNSRVLFFNRNRASIDYQMTTTTLLPQFGFTEALSYNHPKLKGFAPVAVVSILNKGVYPKAGIQFARSKSNYLVFSWVVAETLKQPNIDFFVLLRYMPKLTEKLSLFSQIELVSAFPAAMVNNYSFIQRLRLGVKQKQTQYGLGADFTASGRKSFAATQNIGLFLRYEF